MYIQGDHVRVKNKFPAFSLSRKVNILFPLIFTQTPSRPSQLEFKSGKRKYNVSEIFHLHTFIYNFHELWFKVTKISQHFVIGQKCEPKFS